MTLVSTEPKKIYIGSTECKKVHLGSTQVRPKVYPYLCFTANTAGSTVQLTKTGSPTAVTLETSTDGTNWSTYTIGSTITLSNVGDKVYFRSTSETDTGFSTGESAYYKYVMSGSVSGSGDVSYLLNKNGANTLSTFCFYWLFLGCTSLTIAPNILATTADTYSCGEMYKGCTNLKSCGAIGITTLSGIANFYYMFSGCSNLENLPKLLITSFTSSACERMFNNCSKIKLSTTQTGEYQKVYKLPYRGTGSQSSSFSYMFAGTGGTFTGTPSINTTYYTSNTVV